jgi:hypothetical protein
MSRADAFAECRKEIDKDAAPVKAAGCVPKCANTADMNDVAAGIASTPRVLRGLDAGLVYGNFFESSAPLREASSGDRYGKSDCFTMQYDCTIASDVADCPPETRGAPQSCNTHTPAQPTFAGVGSSNSQLQGSLHRFKAGETYRSSEKQQVREQRLAAFSGCYSPDDLCAACVAQPDEYELAATGADRELDPPLPVEQAPSTAATTASGVVTAQQLGPSDTVSINCVLNTADKTIWTKTPPMGGPSDEWNIGMWMHTAMDKGDEMCGSLLMYYPHDPTARFAAGSIIGGGDSGHFLTTMCDHYNQETGACDGHASEMADMWNKVTPREP